MLPSASSMPRDSVRSLKSVAISCGCANRSVVTRVDRGGPASSRYRRRACSYSDTASLSPDRTSRSPLPSSSTRGRGGPNPPPPISVKAASAWSMIVVGAPRSGMTRTTESAGVARSSESMIEEMASISPGAAVTRSTSSASMSFTSTEVHGVPFEGDSSDRADSATARPTRDGRTWFNTN